MPEVLKRVGRYDLLEVIGRGGAAVVYLAHQRDLRRNIALKELAPYYLGDTSFAERFVEESRLAGGMNHANVVTVHEFFEDGGVPYIAMEYLPYGSLRGYIGRLSTAQIAGVLEGVLAGLSHGEEHRIVHRDLKPENLLVASDGRVKIADFGVARAYNNAATRAVVTVAGTTIGTPAYMSPEQALGTDLTPATDLYSLGVVAWELLTGQVPFEEIDTPVAVLYRHVHEPIPSVRTVAPQVDERIAGWLARMLAKRPEDRFPSADVAWVELEDVVLDLLGPRWRREARLVVGGDGRRVERTLTPAPFHTHDPIRTPPPGPAEPAKPAEPAEAAEPAEGMAEAAEAAEAAEPAEGMAEAAEGMAEAAPDVTEAPRAAGEKIVAQAVDATPDPIIAPVAGAGGSGADDSGAETAEPAGRRAAVAETVTGLRGPHRAGNTTIAPARRPRTNTTLFRIARRHGDGGDEPETAADTTRRRVIALAIVAAMAVAAVAGVAVAGSGTPARRPSGPTAAQRAAAAAAATREREAVATADTTLNTVLTTLGTTRQRDLTAMSNNPSPRSQAGDATEVQKAYTGAAKQVAALSDVLPTATTLSAQLTKLSGDYGQLAAAARVDSQTRFARADRAISADETAFKNDLK